MNDSAITANYTLLYFIVPEGTSPDFIDLVSSFLFLAFFNKDKSGQRKNILTRGRAKGERADRRVKICS